MEDMIEVIPENTEMVYDTVEDISENKEIMIYDSNSTEYTDMPIYDSGVEAEYTEKGRISNNLILGIVISVCVVIGIVLGIIFGKRAANK